MSHMKKEFLEGYHVTSRDLPISILYSIPSVGSTGVNCCARFYTGAGDLNSGPYACYPS